MPYFDCQIRTEVCSSLESHGTWKKKLFEKFIRKRTYIDLRQSATSFYRPNRFERKPMLCVHLNQQETVYHELSKPDETVSTKRHRQKLIKLQVAWHNENPIYNESHKKLIFSHGNSPSQSYLLFQQYLKPSNRELAPQVEYSSEFASFHYDMFPTMCYALL